MTYPEALRILARGDSRIEKLDKALGGLIMAAAPFTAGAALALLESKSEAIGLLRELTDTAPARIKAAKGKTHYELLAAAHTVLVLSAFFDAFREAIGDRGFGELEIAAADVEAIKGHVTQTPPMPSAIRGFAETSEDLSGYFHNLFDEMLSFVEGLAGCPFLIEDTMPAVDERARVALQAFLLRRGIERVPERYRTSLATAAAEMEARLTVHNFNHGDVVAEMVDWAAGAEMADSAVRGLLNVLNTFGEMAWKRVAPSQMARLLRRYPTAARQVKLFASYRQSHPDPSGLSDEDRAILGYRGE